MPTADVNGITIAYDILGNEDAAPILLIAGLGVQMISWTMPFCKILAAKGFRVIRFDNRDVGLSTHLSDAPIPIFTDVAGTLARGERPDIPYTLFDMADDAVGLLDALGIERAHIAGRSMGGAIAQLVANKYPKRTLSLISIMSGSGNPASPPSTPEAMTVLTHQPPHPSENEQGYLDHCVRAAWILRSPAFLFDEKAHRALALEAVGRAYDPSGTARQIAALVVDGDRRERLRMITAPTLVIHGTADPLIPLPAGEDTAANVPGAEFKVFEGMGHEIPPDLYEPIAQAITSHANLITLRG